MLKTVTLFFLIIGPSVYILAVAAIYFGQSKSIFRPQPKGKFTPSDHSVEFEAVTIKNPSGIDLEAWWVPNKGKTLLYCHGNAAVLSDLAHVAKIFHDWGFAVLFIEYRSYGASQIGKLSELGFVEDAVSGYDWIVSKTGKAPDVVWGHSLGSSVAAHLSVKREVKKLILEAPFVSIASMAKGRYPWLPIFNSLIFNPFETAKYISDDKSASKSHPVLFIHGDTDVVVPYSQGRKVFESTNRPKKFITVPDMAHSQFPDVAQNYKDEILSWVLE